MNDNVIVAVRSALFVLFDDRLEPVPIIKDK